MKKFRIVIIFVIGAIVFQGCVKDDGLDVCPQDAAAATIALSIGDMPEVEVRSVATTQERTIYDAYLLVFGRDGKYKMGEKVDSLAITGNGSQTPKIVTNLPLLTGDKVVVLANTGATAMPTTLVAGSSTVDDINAAFPATSWRAPYRFPMSGEMTWNWESTAQKCNMVRAIAKIEIAFADNIAANDVTGEFASGKTCSWQLCECLLFKSALIYAPDYQNGCVVPDNIIYSSFYSASSSTGTITIPNSSVDYHPEYNFSVRARTVKIDSTQFNKGRFHIIMITESGKYYRIDLFDKKTKRYLDLRRNHHYKITITKVKSAGYESVGEAKDNPGSNLEYEVVITGSEDNSITSNGQYAVTTDKSRIIVTDGISKAETLVKFRCEANGIADVTTRKVRLVGADKSTVIPTTRLQMCKSDGTAIAGNVFLYTSAAEAGYQLKFTSPDADALPSELCYVEICYGNIRHYVPVDAYVFEVTPPDAFKYDGTETKSYTVRSYKATESTAVAWTAAEYSVDGGVSWTTAKPAWLTAFTESGAGSTSAWNYSATLAKSVAENPHNDALKAASSVSNYDLSQGGETANCYIVNAPGTYSLPLIYGNARNADGTVNTDAFKPGGSGTRLGTFLSATGTIPDNGKITGATSAGLVWQDAKNLVTEVKLSGSTLTFKVDQSTIQQGNAVVAVTDGTNVLWSWHIWVTDYKLSETPKSFVNYQGVTYKFMPYNIGWCDGSEYPARTVKVRFTQDESGIQRVMDLDQLGGQEMGNSPYFQWGRKDPFVAGMLNSSNAVINKTWYDGSGVEKVNTPPIVASPVWTAGNNATAANNVIKKGILNPDTYCANSYMDYYYTNLWSAQNAVYTANDNAVVKTVYDPSPAGYHLPASNAFTGFTSNGAYQNTTANIYGTWDATSRSWNFAKDGNTVNFPAVGYRNYSSSAVYYVGSNGYCWSAVPSSQGDGRCLHFYSGYVVPVNGNYRAYGFSVRCVQE